MAYLVGFHTLCALLLLLFAEDDEGASVFVKCETHIFALSSVLSGFINSNYYI